MSNKPRNAGVATARGTPKIAPSHGPRVAGHSATPLEPLQAVVHKTINAHDVLLKVLREEDAPKPKVEPAVLGQMKERTCAMLAHYDSLASKALLTSVRKAEYIYWTPEFRELFGEFLFLKLLRGDSKFFKLLAGEVGRASHPVVTKRGSVSSPFLTSMVSGIAQVLAECGPGVEDNPLQDKEIAERLHVAPEVIR